MQQNMEEEERGLEGDGFQLNILTRWLDVIYGKGNYCCSPLVNKIKL